MKPAFVQTILRESENQTDPLTIDKLDEIPRGLSARESLLNFLNFEGGVVNIEDVKAVMLRKEKDTVSALMPASNDGISTALRREMEEYAAQKELDLMKLVLHQRKRADLQRFKRGLRRKLDEVEDRGELHLAALKAQANALFTLRDAKNSNLARRQMEKNARDRAKSLELAEQLGRKPFL